MYLRSGRDLRFRVEYSSEDREERALYTGGVTCNMRCRHAIHKRNGSSGYITVVEDVLNLSGTGASIVESACDAAALFAINLEMHLVNGWRPPGVRFVSSSFSDLFQTFTEYDWDVDDPPQDLVVQGFFNKDNKVAKVLWSEWRKDTGRYYVWRRSGPPVEPLSMCRSNPPEAPKESPKEPPAKQEKAVKSEDEEDNEDDDGSESD